LIILSNQKPSGQCQIMTEDEAIQKIKNK